MAIAIDISPEVAQVMQARADAQGVALADYLAWVISDKIQQDVWADDAELDTEKTFRNLAA